MLAHSRAKVEFYEKYLERYLPIMSLAKFIDTIYIYDVFCGRGVYENGGEGSPLRALKAIINTKKRIPSDTKFVLRLNDNNKNNINSVNHIIASTIPAFEQYCTVEFSSLDAEILLDSIADSLSQTKNNERSLLFIDPYGYKTIHKETIERLLSNGKTEIILFMPISFMHRFKGYAFDPEASEGVAPLRKFTEDLFPIGHPMRKPDEELSVNEYIDFLTDAFSFGDKYYTTSYQIERDKGSYFALFFITSNLLGFEKILDVKWDLDEEDGNGFILAKESQQTTLFDDFFANQKKVEHSNKLKSLLLKYLKEPRSNGELYKYVLKRGYLCRHATEVLKQFQEEGRLEVLDLTTGQSARKSAFYLNYEAVTNPRVRIKLK